MKPDPKSILLGAAIATLTLLLVGANDATPPSNGQELGEIREYRVVTAAQPLFSREVEEALGSGWTLYEGVILDETKGQFSQALVKRRAR